MRQAFLCYIFSSRRPILLFWKADLGCCAEIPNYRIHVEDPSLPTSYLSSIKGLQRNLLSGR